MVKDCCKQELNLEIVSITPDKMVKQCKVCGCKHYHMKAEPGILGTIGMPIGSKRTESS